MMFLLHQRWRPCWWLVPHACRSRTRCIA